MTRRTFFNFLNFLNASTLLQSVAMRLSTIKNYAKAMEQTNQAPQPTLPPTPLFDKWQFYLKDYESPNRFIEWSYYALISAALQRRAWLDEEPRLCFPNMYILFVGPPACGKSLTIAAVADVLRKPQLVLVEPTTKKLISTIPVAPDSITLEGLTRQLVSDHVRFHPFKRDDGKDGLYPHCSLQFLCEELGVLLRQHTKDMVNVLIQGYDARHLERATKGAGTDAVKNICLGMLAGTTPDFLRDAAVDKLIGVGFISRFIVIYESGPRFLRDHPGFSEEQRKAWLDIFTHIKDKVVKEYGAFKFSAEAEEWKKNYYESGQLIVHRANHDITLDHYYSRKHLLWKKLCIILHCSEEYTDRVIQLPTVIRALRVLNAGENNMHLAFTSIGKNSLFNIQLQMLRTIELHTNANNGIFKTHLFRLYNKDLTSVEFQNCVTTLLSTGQVTITNDVIKAVKRKT